MQKQKEKAMYRPKTQAQQCCQPFAKILLIDVPDHIASGDILSVRPLKIQSEWSV